MSRDASQAELATGLGNRIAPLRFVLFLAIFAGGYLAYRIWLPVDDWRDGAAMAFDCAALVFLISLVPLLRKCSVTDIRRHASENAANRVLVLGLTTLLTLVVMAAITGELKAAQNGETMAMTKLVGTLLAIWLFANSIYTLHYAHAFYSRDPKKGGDCGGIDFPKTEHPEYWDFAYSPSRSA